MRFCFLIIKVVTCKLGLLTDLKVGPLYSKFKLTTRMKPCDSRGSYPLSVHSQGIVAVVSLCFEFEVVTSRFRSALAYRRSVFGL